MGTAPGRFRVILADPPWAFSYGSSPARLTPYVTASHEWIARLPVAEVAAKDAVLLLWGVGRSLPAAFAVLAAWGFEFKTMATWVKMSRAAAPRIGCGFHVRNCTEQLLIGTRGKVRAPDTGRRPPDVFFCSPGEHSVKPECQYDIAENYPGPYLELFHRPRGGLFGPREGWVFLGDAVDGQDMRQALLGARSLMPDPQNLPQPPQGVG
jgi:N6-adenosine-specific RNA methylase IME4